MLKECKNRGAGLVTVVVVLAVSGILLSGVLLLSYSHYKNVMTAEIQNNERAELDLCAELVCMTMTQPTDTLDAICKEDTLLSHFYVNESYSGVSSNGATISLQDFALQLSLKNDMDFSEGLKIQYLRDGHTIAETIYMFEYNDIDGKYTFYRASEVSQ